MFTLNRAGLTLVELLIVVVVLGVVAAIAIPQLSTGTHDSRLAELDTGLSECRHAIELYYHQHGNTYPGARRHTDGEAVTTALEARSAFVSQLTLYSDVHGTTSTTRSTRYKLGPYLKAGIPQNPFNGLASVDTDIRETSIGPLVTDGGTGWKFYVQTGRFVANDGDHDAN